MSREVKERTILDTFAEDFVDVVKKHAKYIIVSGFECIQSEYPELIYDDYLNNKTSVRYVRKGISSRKWN